MNYCVRKCHVVTHFYTFLSGHYFVKSPTMWFDRFLPHYSFENVVSLSDTRNVGPNHGLVYLIGKACEEHLVLF